MRPCVLSSIIMYNLIVQNNLSYLELVYNKKKIQIFFINMTSVHFILGSKMVYFIRDVAKIQLHIYLLSQNYKHYINSYEQIFISELTIRHL